MAAEEQVAASPRPVPFGTTTCPHCKRGCGVTAEQLDIFIRCWSCGHPFKCERSAVVTRPNGYSLEEWERDRRQNAALKDVFLKPARVAMSWRSRVRGGLWLICLGLIWWSATSGYRPVSPVGMNSAESALFDVFASGFLWMKRIEGIVFWLAVSIAADQVVKYWPSE